MATIVCTSELCICSSAWDFILAVRRSMFLPPFHTGTNSPRRTSLRSIVLTSDLRQFDRTSAGIDDGVRSGRGPVRFRLRFVCVQGEVVGESAEHQAELL